MAELLESKYSQLLNIDRLSLNNVLHYYNAYHELISKVVSILDSFVPKEIAGHGGCNLSVSHDVESRIVSIVYGDIIVEDVEIESIVDSMERKECERGDWILDDDHCEEVNQDDVDGLIEEILESELVDSPSGEMIEPGENAVNQHGHEKDTHQIDAQQRNEHNEHNGFSCSEDLVAEGSPYALTTEGADMKYICQYVDCPKTFFRAKEYSIHQEKAHPWLVETEIEVRCKYIHCQARFNSINLLYAHHDKHRVKNVKRKKVPTSKLENVCLDVRMTKKKIGQDRHVRVRKCEFCEAILDCKVNVYIQHCLEEHDRSAYACPVCRAPFHLQSHLCEHVKAEHSQKEIETLIAQDLWREFTVQEGVRMAECRFCYRIITSQMSRENHAEQHRKEVWKTCTHCGGKHSEAFCSHPKPQFFAKLEKLHCAQCDRWMSKKNFREHLVTHTKERNFPCTVCKKTFKVQRTATRHIQNHINASNRKRKCYECSTVFTDEAEIPEHYRLEHPLVAPYRCPICGEGFHEKTPLADHCHTHTDNERRMVSITAPLTSYQIGSARVFECTLCRRSFSTKRSTIAHLIVHTDRPFVCPQCSLSFRVEPMLAMHMVDVHQVKDVSIAL